MNCLLSEFRINTLKKFLVSLASVFIASVPLNAQFLKGKITDKNGEPVQYATVFFQEIRQGTTSNPKGNYEIRLQPGNYTVIYQSLGYEPYMTTISISVDTIIKNIVLTEQYYQIPEVKITEKGEDPAYYIMRRAIGLAPFYLNHINHYKAEVYLKGNLYIKKIPKIIRRSLKIEAGRNSKDSPDIKIVIKEGDSFLLESYNEIEFTAPDKYIQRVISVNSSFPAQGDDISPMDYIKASFYQPVIAEVAISPLSPSAFSYYKYKYLGASLQGDRTVNKIEVIPKTKSPQLFAGTIYIIEDLWCIHSVDLSNENMAGKIHIKEVHIPVQDDIWMPVSHYFEMNFGIMGLRADVFYRSSVKYVKVEPNKNLQKPDPLTVSYTSGANIVSDTLMTRTKKKIEEILSKKEMSNRDMIRLADLMNKESASSIRDSVVKKLEIKDNTKYIIEKDAGKKDSAFWAEIRPIPLSDNEIRILSEKNNENRLRSMKSDSSVSAVHKKKIPFVRDLRYLAFGHTWSDSTGFRFTSGGLINLKSFGFNSVDGFLAGTDFRISKRLKNNWNIALYPDIRYAFSREKVLWRANMNITHGGMKPGRIFIQSGMTSRDISSGGGVSSLLNSATSLLLKKNYLKLYESRYLNFGCEFEISNGFNLEINTGFDDRRVLENNTDFSFFKKSARYSDNVPDNQYLNNEEVYSNLLYDQKQYSLGASIRLVPRQKYKIQNGNKIPAGSDWPDFLLSYKHLINTDGFFSAKYSHFNLFRLEVTQKLNTGAFREFKWMIRAGGYTDNRGIPFFDFFHFNSQTFPFLVYNYDDALMIPAYYSLSTPEFFTEGHIKYTSPYLLLKFLPGLNRTLVRENLIFSYLRSRYHPNYTEIGYSLSEIFLIGELGFYVGFDDLKYRAAAIKFSIRFN